MNKYDIRALMIFIVIIVFSTFHIGMTMLNIKMTNDIETRVQKLEKK